MHYSHLVFIRSKYAFREDVADPLDIAAVSACGGFDVMGSSDTILCGIAADRNAEFGAAIFADRGVPTWVDHYEVVEVGFHVAHAAPKARSTEWYGEVFDHDVPRGSELLARRLVPHIEREPARARKLLIVAFESELDDRRLGRVDDAFRKALGHRTRPVWQGRDFRGYCFTHHLKCKEASEIIAPLAVERGVGDFLMVEPLGVAYSSRPLSPLKDWVDAGYSRMQSATLHNHRRRRDGRRGS